MWLHAMAAPPPAQVVFALWLGFGATYHLDDISLTNRETGPTPEGSYALFRQGDGGGARRAGRLSGLQWVWGTSVHLAGPAAQRATPAHRLLCLLHACSGRSPAAGPYRAGVVRTGLCAPRRTMLAFRAPGCECPWPQRASSCEAEPAHPLHAIKQSTTTRTGWCTALCAAHNCTNTHKLKRTWITSKTTRHYYRTHTHTRVHVGPTPPSPRPRPSTSPSPTSSSCTASRQSQHSGT